MRRKLLSETKQIISHPTTEKNTAGTRRKPHETRAAILLLLTAMIWGFAFTAQTEGVKHMPSFTFNGVRFALGTVSLVPVLFIFERKKLTNAQKKNTILGGVIAGVVLFAAGNLQQFGITLGGNASKAGFITALYIILVPVCGVFLKKKTGVNVWLGACLAVIGLWLLCGRGGGGFSGGDLLLLLCALFWTAHILVVDKYVGGALPIRFSLIQFAVCTALTLFCALCFEDITLGGIIEGRTSILYAGILSVGVAYTLQIIGQRDLDAGKAAIIFSLESVFAAIGGAIILNEKLPLLGYIGCVLMFSGTILSQVKFRDKRKST